MTDPACLCDNPKCYECNKHALWLAKPKLKRPAIWRMGPPTPDPVLEEDPHTVRARQSNDKKRRLRRQATEPPKTRWLEDVIAA